MYGFAELKFLRTEAELAQIKAQARANELAAKARQRLGKGKPVIIEGSCERVKESRRCIDTTSTK